MRKMKDSGNPWFGSIPDSWYLKRIKYLFHIKKDIAGEDGHTVLSITQKGIIPKDLSKNEGQLAESYANYQLVKTGDFAMNHMDLLTGWIDVSKYDGVTSPDYRVFVLDDSQNNDKSYYLYLFQTCYSSRIFYGLGQGVSGLGRWRLQADKFLNFVIPVPPIAEQRAIPAYLDRQCAHIDNIIEKTKASIEEYKKLRQAVITQAVTKGVRGDRPMKDSGIEWIGEIPEEWKVNKLKYYIDFIESGTSVKAGQNEATEGQLGVLKTSSVSKQTFNIHENKSVNEEEYNRVSCPVKANTIIVSRMNTPELVGACGYVDCDYPNIYLPDRLWQVHFLNNINVKFVFYWLVSSGIRFYYASLAVGTSSSMQNISQDQFYNAFCTIPSYTEQEKIAAYLDQKCAEIDTLIAKKEAFLTELETYKKSMIYEYVTGKKEVPQA